MYYNKIYISASILAYILLLTCTISAQEDQVKWTFCILEVRSNVLVQMVELIFFFTYFFFYVYYFPLYVKESHFIQKKVRNQNENSLLSGLILFICLFMCIRTRRRNSLEMLKLMYDEINIIFIFFFSYSEALKWKAFDFDGLAFLGILLNQWN